MELKIVIQWKVGYPTWAVESLIRGEVLPSEGEVYATTSPSATNWKLLRRAALSVVLSEQEECVTKRPGLLIVRFGPVFLKESTYLRLLDFKNMGDLEKGEFFDRLIHGIIDTEAADEFLGFEETSQD